MKKIINRRLYDTSTALLLGRYEYSDENDFENEYEALYRKKNGEFFLYGAGGPRSAYRVSLGNGWYGDGETIIPFSEEKAKNWAEKHLDADKYVAAFGDVEE